MVSNCLAKILSLTSIDEIVFSEIWIETYDYSFVVAE
jgi:hypothetical protein